MINKKWIGLFCGIFVGIFIGILPFLAWPLKACTNYGECSKLFVWPWYIPSKIIMLLGFTGGPPGIIVLFPFFYAIIVAIIGYFIGKRLDKMNKKF